jgi:hypothetical protein
MYSVLVWVHLGGVVLKIVGIGVGITFKNDLCNVLLSMA